MHKLKSKFKNLIYSIGFLFRPITAVAVSFVFLVLSCVLLVSIILNLDENTKIYQVLLAILTGVTASLMITIMMELYNNYSFNTKRQREVREYLRHVASYEIHQNSIMKSNFKYESDSILGNGRTYAVFCRLYSIIPTLRAVLNHRDYLYRKEIDWIDDILYSYDDLVKVIWIDLLNAFMELISSETDKIETEGLNEGHEAEGLEENILENHELAEDYESIRDYPWLFSFLEKEAKRYLEKKDDLDLYEEAPRQLESIIEKAIFSERSIFNEYFEITDSRCELDESVKNEEYLGSKVPRKDKKIEFRSKMISYACSDIDKAMFHLQRRVAKEPYFWTMASYKEKKK